MSGKVDAHEILRLGMFVNEIQHLSDKYGFHLQGAKVMTPTQAEPVATICAGGGDYTVTMGAMLDAN